MRDSIQVTEKGSYLAMESDLSRDIVMAVAQEVEVELEFLPMGARTTEVYLEPIVTPAIEGKMSFCTGCPSDGIVMNPVSGSHELPVFAFIAGPVASEAMSFGQVKALYR